VSAGVWKAVGILVAIVIAANLALQRIDRAIGTPGGPTSSSFATARDGLAAYAELLDRNGHRVVRLRTAPAESELDRGSTVVVLDPQGLTGEDVRVLRMFVEAGGRLVAGGLGAGAWLGQLLDDPPVWAPGGPTVARPLVPAPELVAVRRVRAAGEGSWRDSGAALPAVAGRAQALVSVATPGDGRAVLLADASPLQNRLLDRADNAALGLGLAGGRGRTVVFAESVHGYGRASGLRAIPGSWRWTLGGLLVAALVWMVARGRRLGPPERARRALAPPRREYVEALGTVLARTRSPAAALARLERGRLARAVEARDG
jgi:hypothetical protein